MSDELLVKFRPGKPGEDKGRLAKERHNLKVQHGFVDLDAPGLEEIGVTYHRVPPGLAKQTVEKLMRHPLIEWAEVEGTLQGEPLFEPAGNEWHLFKMRVPEAHALGHRGAGAKFGILDSGYKHAEPYFAGRIAGEKNFVTGIGETQTTTEDNEGHGSACLGLGIQVGPEARGWVGRVMSNNQASWSNVAAGALWLKDLVTVISCSIGGATDSFVLRDAAAKVKEKGVAWICAAGNQGSSVKQYPAATAGNCSIAATNADDARCGFSNFGDWVHAAAPGEGLATVGGTFSGTSGACPLFGMVVAMAAAKFGITGLEALARVKAACKLLVDKSLGAGRVDLMAALGLAATEPPPGGPTPPPAPTDKPAAPHNLRATDVTANGFILRWDQEPYAAGLRAWEIYGGNFRFETVETRYGRMFVAITRPYGWSPYLRVKAVGWDGKESDLSAYLDESVVPGAPPPPPPPPPTETWTPKSAQTAESGLYGPATVEQSRQVVTTITTWEESNLGNKRNVTTATVTTTENRTVPLPTI